MEVDEDTVLRHGIHSRLPCVRAPRTLLMKARRGVREVIVNMSSRRVERLKAMLVRDNAMK